MKTSESISKIMPDLVKAQSQMGAAKKGANNPYFKSKYADLGAIMEVCKDVLNENGIVYLQPIIGDAVQTILIHQSGEWIADEGTRILFAKESDPQAQGSAITYARRYGLQSFLGIPAEDDDGEKAVRKPKVDEVKKATVNTPQPKEPVEDTAFLCSACGDVITQDVYEYSMRFKGKPLCRKDQKGAA